MNAFIDPVTTCVSRTDFSIIINICPSWKDTMVSPSSWTVQLNGLFAQLLPFSYSGWSTWTPVSVESEIDVSNPSSFKCQTSISCIEKRIFVAHQHWTLWGNWAILWRNECQRKWKNDTNKITFISIFFAFYLYGLNLFKCQHVNRKSWTVDEKGAENAHDQWMHSTVNA